MPDDLWAALRDRYRDDQLLELVVIAGWYRLLSYVINAARVPLEPWATRFASAAPCYAGSGTPCRATTRS